MRSVLLCLCYQQLAGIIRRTLPRLPTDRAPRLRVPLRPKGKARPGRPPVHSETWSKVSVVLFDRQIRDLDRLTKTMRDGNGKAMNRAEVIRALIDGLIESGMDVSGAGSEASLRARVARRLGTPYR
jgi:hypothetical protein